MSTQKESLLDNPVWNALTTGNAALSIGGNLARCFQKEISPFVGLKSFDITSFNALLPLVAPEEVVAIAAAEYCELPPEWKAIQREKITQMIYRGADTKMDSDETIIALDESYVPRMLELTALTKPGPFLNQTIRFGGYHGIFDSDSLIAITGRRMHAGHFIEISAVCTHPDHTGKGYGTRLILDQIQRIKSEAAIPFLHVRENNFGAIRLYKELGFQQRQEIHLLLFKKIIG